MGLSVGTETYYKYLKSFGLMDKTGIDMIGEVKGIFQDEKSFNSQVVSLASYSFGQTFNVTPIEMCIRDSRRLKPISGYCISADWEPSSKQARLIRHRRRFACFPAPLKS